MKNNNPPEFEKLIDWLEGRLTPEEAQLVSEQMAAADAAAHEDVAWLEKFYRASQNQTVAEPPSYVTERLEKRFANYAATRRHPSLWQRFMARLSFDSRLTLATGIRAAATADNQRQLVYETDLASVALTLQQRTHDPHLDLLGQLLPTQAIEADLVRVALFQEQVEFDSTMTDDLGEFTLTALPTGLYTLILTGDQYEIKISPLPLSIYDYPSPT